MPDPELSAFLAAGGKPIYVGFGSMPGLDPQNVTTMIVEALRRTGKRGLLATGGGALSATAMPEYAHFIAAAPHDRLLPLVSATIHHGGAGTTAASLRAGLPTAIVPFFGDQLFWGRRVEALGAGPSPLDRKTLSIESLSAAIVAMEETTIRKNAAELGLAIRDEDGLAAAIGFMEAKAATAHITG